MQKSMVEEAYANTSNEPATFAHFNIIKACFI